MKKTKQKISLVLASGGARGIAHIGAIEELENRGYEISSIAGTSMGALVGGFYASGGLDVYRDWLCELNKLKMLSLMDFTLSINGIVKGAKIMNELKKIVPDVNIENCNIPFSAVATDIISKKEIIFDKGSLYQAIRASISIPSFFKPYELNDMILIDGGVVNPLPLNRVKRAKNDILVAVDVSGPTEQEKIDEQKKVEQKHEEESGIQAWFKLRNIKLHEKEEKEVVNYYTILSQSSSIMIQRITSLMLDLYKPDILISMPRGDYGTLEFYKSEEFIKQGIEKTREALDIYEKKKQ